MRKISKIILIATIPFSVASCDPDGYICTIIDEYTVTNATGKTVALTIGKRNYEPISHIPESVALDTVFWTGNNGQRMHTFHFTFIFPPGETLNTDTLRLCDTERRCNGKPTQHTSQYWYNDGTWIYNLTDTTSIDFLCSPYDNPWFETSWGMRDLTYINRHQLTVTDSLVGLMRKDYSMLERFADYYSSAGQ